MHERHVGNSSAPHRGGPLYSVLGRERGRKIRISPPQRGDGKRFVADHHYNVLFVCTGNSARSIMGESLINYWGAHQFRGHSAGSRPHGNVHPLTLDFFINDTATTE